MKRRFYRLVYVWTIPYGDGTTVWHSRWGYFDDVARVHGWHNRTSHVTPDAMLDAVARFYKGYTVKIIRCRTDPMGRVP